jgi:hypothetical protein
MGIRQTWTYSGNYTLACLAGSLPHFFIFLLFFYTILGSLKLSGLFYRVLRKALNGTRRFIGLINERV